MDAPLAAGNVVDSIADLAAWLIIGGLIVGSAWLAGYWIRHLYGGQGGPPISEQ